jgi:hypothetical protein
MMAPLPVVGQGERSPDAPPWPVPVEAWVEPDEVAVVASLVEFDEVEVEDAVAPPAPEGLSLEEQPSEERIEQIAIDEAPMTKRMSHGHRPSEKVKKSRIGKAKPS